MEPAPADTLEPQPEPAIPQLSESEITGLKEVVKAGKDAVALLDYFGEQAGFVQNMASQQAELAELLHLAEKYGIDVPAISPNNMPSVASLDDALTLAGLYANIKNVAQNNLLPRQEMKG